MTALDAALSFISRDVMAFKRYDMGERYVVGQFHRLAAAALTDVLHGRCLRLMIQWPPRHGKTELLLGGLTPLFIGNNPTKDVLMTASDATLARLNSRKTRNIVRGQKFNRLFPHVRIADDSAAVDEWSIHRYGGHVRAAGLGQGIQGRGGHLGIADDLVKAMKQIRSQAWQTTFREWYQSDFRDRIYPGGAIVISGTRWGQSDPQGWLLSDEFKYTIPWTVLTFPAYRDGQWLWPERYTIHDYEDLRNSMSRLAWQAKFMQDPLPEGDRSIEFSWFKRIAIGNLPTIFTRRGMGVDPSSSSKESSDPRVAMPARVDTEGRIYLGPPIRNQKQWPKFRRDVVEYAQLLKVTQINYESNAMGESQADDIAELLPGVVVHKSPRLVDKTIALSEWSPLAESGQLYLVDDGSGWLGHFENECDNFPIGEHDDILDAMGHAIASVRSQKPIVQNKRFTEPIFPVHD